MNTCVKDRDLWVHRVLSACRILPHTWIPTRPHFRHSVSRVPGYEMSWLCGRGFATQYCNALLLYFPGSQTAAGGEELLCVVGWVG